VLPKEQLIEKESSRPLVVKLDAIVVQEPDLYQSVVKLHAVKREPIAEKEEIPALVVK